MVRPLINKTNANLAKYPADDNVQAEDKDPRTQQQVADTEESRGESTDTNVFSTGKGRGQDTSNSETDDTDTDWLSPMMSKKGIGVMGVPKMLPGSPLKTFGPATTKASAQTGKLPTTASAAEASGSKQLQPPPKWLGPPVRPKPTNLQATTSTTSVPPPPVASKPANLQARLPPSDPITRLCEEIGQLGKGENLTKIETVYERHKRMHQVQYTLEMMALEIGLQADETEQVMEDLNKSVPAEMDDPNDPKSAVNVPPPAPGASVVVGQGDAGNGDLEYGDVDQDDTYADEDDDQDEEMGEDEDKHTAPFNYALAGDVDGDIDMQMNLVMCPDEDQPFDDEEEEEYE